MTISARDDAETVISPLRLTIMIYEAEDGETGYWGEVIEMPGCVSQGETIAELKANMQEAIEAIGRASRTSVADAPSQLMVTGLDAVKTRPTSGTGTA